MAPRFPQKNTGISAPAAKAKRPTNGQRPLRVGEAVRHALSQVLMRHEINDAVLSSMMITVSEVRMSPDLRHATAFVTPLGGGDCTPVLRELKRCAPRLRSAVAQHLKMRFAAELHFQPDTSFDYAQTITQALQSGTVAADIGHTPAIPDEDDTTPEA